jgi:hypothetical protein
MTKGTVIFPEDVYVEPELIKGIRLDVQCGLLGVNVHKSLGRIILTDPACQKENPINMDDVKADVASSGKLSALLDYVKVVEDLKPLEDSKEFVEFLLARSTCISKNPERIGHITEKIEVTSYIVCKLCERKIPLKITAEAKEKAKVPLNWLQYRGLISEKTAEGYKDDLNEMFLLHDNDRPDILVRLLDARELIQALDVKPMPLNWKSHERLAYLIFPNEIGKPSSLERANEFTKRIQGLQSDIKNAAKVDKEFNESLEQLSQFNVSEVREFFNKTIKVTMPNEIEKLIAKKARRLLADSLLWLSEEITKVVNEGKLEVT